MTRSLLILVLLAAPALADGPQSCAVPLANFTVHDGDTITHVDLVLPFGLTIRDKTIRAAGFDAYEISRARRTVNVTPIEIERGKLAKAALERLIERGSLYAVDTGKQDVYGRLLAVLWVRTREGEFIDVAEFMRREGHTREP